MLRKEHFENKYLEMFLSLCDFLLKICVNMSPLKILISVHLKLFTVDICMASSALPSKQNLSAIFKSTQYFPQILYS